VRFASNFGQSPPKLSVAVMRVCEKQMEWVDTYQYNHSTPNLVKIVWPVLDLLHVDRMQKHMTTVKDVFFKFSFRRHRNGSNKRIIDRFS
jgi:hypothetical protein